MWGIEAKGFLTGKAYGGKMTLLFNREHVSVLDDKYLIEKWPFWGRWPRPGLHRFTFACQSPWGVLLV